MIKKLILLVLITSTCYADNASDLMGLGMPPALATEVDAQYSSAIGASIIPGTDDAYDLGTASLEFQDGFFDGTLTTDVLVNSGASTLTGNIGFGGTLIGTGTSTIGWAVIAGANTACTTTCVTPCVFGINTAATEADIVDCADATADECLCAGAS